MTPDQRVRACLVDGTPVAPSERVELTQDEIRDEVRALVADLEARGERHWVRRLGHALDDEAWLYGVAHYLRWLGRDRCLRWHDAGRLDRLLYALGLHLPAPGPRPPGKPLFNFPGPVW